MGSCCAKKVPDISNTLKANVNGNKCCNFWKLLCPCRSKSDCCDNDDINCCVTIIHQTPPKNADSL